MSDFLYSIFIRLLGTNDEISLRNGFRSGGPLLLLNDVFRR